MNEKEPYLFAIVEDNDSEYEAMVSLFRAYENEKDVVIKTRRFRSAIAFLVSYHSEYDAVFFDVDLPGLDGLEASKKLRKVDPMVPLVFVTNLRRYTLKGYEVNAVNYLLKPVQKEDAFRTFDTVVHITRINERESILVHTLEGYARIVVNSILYVDVSSHHVCYHTLTGEFRVRSSMKETVALLGEKRFALCNSGTLVNLSHVDFFDKDCIIVKGEKLLFARSRKKAFMEKMSLFLAFS